MKKTTEEFEKRGVECFYASLAPEAKKARWKKREAKINAKSSVKSAKGNLQPSLFD